MEPKGKILYLDDDEDIRKLFTVFFEEQGYALDAVSAQAECFAICEKFHPDILILSRFINDEDFQLLNSIRGNENIPYIPIVVQVYKIKDEKWVQRIFTAGANACYGGVFDIGDLIQIVDQLLENPKTTGIVDRQTKLFQQKKHSEANN